MRLIKILDEGGYTEDMPVVLRKTVRAIIYKDGKIAMQKSRDGELKIPGGGQENGECLKETLKREVREETGMIIKEKSIRELGKIIELRRDCFDAGKKYECHTYYYLCDVTEERLPLQLTESELRMGYECVWETLEHIYSCKKDRIVDYWEKRDMLFLKMILDGEIKIS